MYSGKGEWYIQSFAPPGRYGLSYSCSGPPPADGQIGYMISGSSDVTVQ